MLLNCTRIFLPSPVHHSASKGHNQAAPESERAVPGGDEATGSATPLPLGVVNSVGEVKRVCAG